MIAQRRGTAKTVRNSLLKSRLLLVTISPLIMTSTVVCASFLATTAVYAMTPSIVVFDFDAGSPPPSLYQNTPFNYLTSSGVTAYFSSPSDPISPAFSVQNSIPVGYNMSMFSGQWLYDNQVTSDYLDIKFNWHLYSINLTFAIPEPHGGPGVLPAYINLTGYMDSVGTTPVGWTWARGETASEQNTQGTLSFNSSGQPFNLVRIGIPPNQPPFNPTDFFVDNIVIMAAPAADTAPPVTAVSLTGTLGNLGWYKSDVTVTLSATDDLSGVNRTEYSFDNATWTTYVTSFNISTQGTTTVYFKSTDNAGNIETVKTLTVKVDTNSPVTTISLTGTPGNITVTLSATDQPSGVANTQYSFDNAAWTTYTTPFIVTDPTKTTLYYRSADNAGNIETTKTETLTGDTTPPITTINLNGTPGDQGWYTSNVDVSLSATDDWSGVAKTEYSFDGATWITYSTFFTITTEGTTTLYYKSTDAVGNAETIKTKTVKIDKSLPTGSILINNGNTSTNSTPVTLTLTSSDAYSGVFEVRYSNDGVWDTEPWEAPSPTKAWTLTSGIGTKTVSYQIRDNAGLVSLTYQDSIMLEAPPPSIDTTRPVANAGPDQATTEDTIIVLNASATTDNVAIATYTWTLTDGTTKALTGMIQTYIFATPGIYTVMLNATDTAGNWATDTLIIEVIDTTAPVAIIGQDRTVNAGEPLSLDAALSSDNVGIVSYQWECGDGTSDEGATITHTYDNPGTYTVTLTLVDAAGNIGNDSIAVTVLPPNRPYTLWIILAVAAIGIGATITLFLKKRK